MIDKSGVCANPSFGRKSRKQTEKSVRFANFTPNSGHDEYAKKLQITPSEDTWFSNAKSFEFTFLISDFPTFNTRVRQTGYCYPVKAVCARRFIRFLHTTGRIDPERTRGDENCRLVCSKTPSKHSSRYTTTLWTTIV